MATDQFTSLPNNGPQKNNGLFIGGDMEISPPPEITPPPTPVVKPPSSTRNRSVGSRSSLRSPSRHKRKKNNAVIFILGAMVLAGLGLVIYFLMNQ